MPIVEFAGTARSGKTTIAQKIRNKIPTIIHYPERYDVIPPEIKSDTQKYDFWYAKFTIERYDIALQKPNDIHLLERGVIDRIVYGRANYQMDWFTKQQLDEYLALLMPYVSKNDLTFIFKIPVDLSVDRAQKMGKDVSDAVPFLEILYKLYSDLKDEYPNLVYLPENSSLDDLEALVLTKIKNLTV